MTGSQGSKGINIQSGMLALAALMAVATPAAASSGHDPQTQHPGAQAAVTSVSQVPPELSSEETDLGQAQLIPLISPEFRGRTTQVVQAPNPTAPAALEQSAATQTQPSVVVTPDSATDPIEQTTDPQDSKSATKPGAESSETPAVPTQDATNEGTMSGPTSTDIALEQLMAADSLFLEGKTEDAEALYRQVKDPFFQEDRSWYVPDPITDLEQLSIGGRVFWREGKRGLSQEMEISALVPLRLLVEKNPEFVPGHLKLAEALVAHDQADEALAVMEAAAALYPSQPDLQKGLIERQVASMRWLEASITARQFSLLNPEHPDAPELLAASEKYQKLFQSYLKEQATSNMIGGVLTGALGVALTGNPFMALPTVQTGWLMMRGEEAVGNAAAQTFKKRMELIEDPEVQAYVDRIGHKLAQVGGREFDYEFVVVKSEDLNAFALPGGKIFINGGAIVKSKSEAELAGLLAHELAHAILSHGFQSVTQSTATAGFTRLIPYVGGIATRLAVSNYSREMEEQADILGTRMLVSAGYAADGLRNLMATIAAENKETPFHLLSTHPKSKERISYLEALIERNGYNRFRYEGVLEHKQISQRVQTLLEQEGTEQNIDQAIDDYTAESPQGDAESIEQGRDNLPEVQNEEDQVPEVQAGTMMP